MADAALLESASGLLLEDGFALDLEGAVPIPSPDRGPHVRERPPLRRYITLETPGGRRFRWSEQEPDPANVVNSWTESSIAPGGFDHGAGILPRKSGTDYSDLERLSTVTVKGVGGDVAWQGRLERAPRTSGDSFSISPDCSGYQAELANRSDIRVVYVDRDLGRWQEASRARKLALFAIYDRVEAGGSEPDATSGLPALKQSIQGAQTDSAFTANEMWYDGIDGIESIYYDYVITNGLNTALFYGLYVADDDLATAATGTGDLFGSATGSGTFTPAAAERWGLIQLLNTATWADETERVAQTRNLAVFGNNGLTKRGTAPDEGYWASDVIGHAVGKWCPGLTTTSESIQDSGFVIGQLAFPDPTTVADIVTQANRFHLYDWMVWEDKTFWYHPRGARGRSWRARIAPAQLEETGPQIDRMANVAVVTYQDVDGTPRTVGPPGVGVSYDAYDSVLFDDDPENPLNQKGLIKGPPVPLDVGTATLAEATEVGRRYLQEQKLLDTSGRATLVGHVQDDHGTWHPAWRVRAGDAISFVDASDKSPRRIVQASYDHSTRTTSVDLDSPPEALANLLERLGVANASMTTPRSTWKSRLVRH